MGRDHSEPCPRCGVYVGGLNETECDCVPDPFPNELVEAAAKAYEDGWRESRGDHSVALGQSLAAVLPRIEQRVSRDAYPQAWRYGAAEENARIVAALRAKGTHAADVLADQIEMEAP